MPSYLFKSDGIDPALPVTPQGEAWSWLELGAAGPAIYLWLINLYSSAPVLQLSAEEDFPRLAGGLRPLAVDSIGNLIAQELDLTDTFIGRQYLISRTGVILYTDDSSAGDDEISQAWFDSLGRLWGEIAAGDDRVKIHSAFDYTLHTRTDAWSSSFGAGDVALFFRAGAIAGRVYASRRDAGGVQRFGYFNAAGVWVPLVTFGGSAGGRGAVGLDGNLYIGKAEAGERDILQKYDADGTLITAVPLTDADPADTLLTAMLYDGLGRLWIQGTGSGTANAWCVNAGTMEVEIFGEVDNVLLVPGQDFDGRSAVALITTPSTGRNQLGIFQFAPRISAGTVDLGLDIVRPLCLRSGLDISEIDVNSLIGTEVIGYVIPARSAVREMIEPLMGVFLFDAVESDDKVKFVMRGSLPIIDIPERDIGAEQDQASEDEELLQLERKQEMELPVEINLAYMSAASDYEVAQQPSRRLITQARESVTLSVPLVLTDDRAKQSADAMMFCAWMERQSVGFSTGRKYSRYEPTDVIRVFRDGIAHQVRFAEKDAGANGVLRWKGIYEEPSIYTQYATGVPSPAPNSQVNPPAPTIAQLLDIPMLRETENNPGFYYGAYGVDPSEWPGALLYQSSDAGDSYQLLSNSQLLDASTIGAALSALPVMIDLFAFMLTGDPDSLEYNELFDESSALDVLLASGSLQSATREQLLNSANAALVGTEVIQFRDATLLAPNHYQLTGLLRGRLGTEHAMDAHVVGERFVLLDQERLRTLTQTFGQLNASYLYKPVTIGSSLQHAAAMPFINTGVRRKPLAPWRFVGGRNLAGDVILQWKPRSRFPIIWGLGVENPPGETEERYAVYIPDFASAVRVLVSSTPEVIYTAAQQIIDFGILQNPLQAQVCQVSPEFGLGYFTSGVL